MPNYPYRCLKCQKRFEIFMTYAEYGSRPVTCPHCESQEVQRRIARVRVAKSIESRMENVEDPSSLEGLEDDPRALGKMLRKMEGQVGEEIGPEFSEVIDRLEAGQSPEEIEESMPELNLPGDNLPGEGLAGGGMLDEGDD
jgi:putative FmdB family regulatory protein